MYWLKLHVKNYTILFNTFGTFLYSPVLMSVISKIMPDLKAMKYADLTAAMPLILYTPTPTPTLTPFFWFPVPHKLTQVTYVYSTSTLPSPSKSVCASN
jgi:hypothetical protein